jgi:hypothetical protein
VTLESCHRIPSDAGLPGRSLGCSLTHARQCLRMAPSERGIRSSSSQLLDPICSFAAGGDKESPDNPPGFLQVAGLR